MAIPALIEGIVLFVGMPLFFVVAALAAEFCPQAVAWWHLRFGFAERGQSEPVRRCALRLASRRRNERVKAAQLLADMGDESAAGALTRAAARYESDGRMMEITAQALARVGDERAIPILRRIASGRQASVMLAAREALSQIEARATLLRPATQPDARTLLRPASGATGDHESLLRAC